MARELLADADFFIALYKRDDTNHARAVKLLEKIGAEKTNLALSILAYSEITTVLSQRVSKAVARNFIKDFGASGAHIVHTSDALVKGANAIFEAQRSKNVSFTDAGNIALMRAGEFDSLVSFDADYGKNRIKLFA